MMHFGIGLNFGLFGFSEGSVGGGGGGG